jgi:hypothetical protein
MNEELVSTLFNEFESRGFYAVMQDVATACNELADKLESESMKQIWAAKGRVLIDLATER